MPAPYIFVLLLFLHPQQQCGAITTNIFLGTEQDSLTYFYTNTLIS